MMNQQKNQQNQQKNQRIQKMKAIDLSERQKQILVYMDAGVEYSTEQIAEKIGLKGPRTRQLLNELVNMELLACMASTYPCKPSALRASSAYSSGETLVPIS